MGFRHDRGFLSDTACRVQYGSGRGLIEFRSGLVLSDKLLHLTYSTSLIMLLIT